METAYKLGALPDPLDKRDILLSSYLIPRKLPCVISWGDTEIPIKDQDGQPACVGFSCASMKETQEKIEFEKLCKFDGLKLYQRCKEVDGIPDQSGTYIRIALKILQNEGIVAEQDDFSQKVFRIASYSRVQTINEIKYGIVSSGPVVAGVAVFRNWFSPPCGIIDLPSPNLAEEGGHAILITGYDENRKWFYFCNSWGREWGREGRGLLTYRYVEKYLQDAWAVIDLEDKIVNSFLDIKKMSKDIKKVKEE